MTDIFEPEARSYIMSKIKKVDTKPELIVRKFLYRNGFRYKIHEKKILGNPDIVLKRYKTVIFVNGCFWHAHKDCKLSKMPKSNLEYWLPKIKSNIERDIKNHQVLQGTGWNVVIIWECQLELEKQELTLKKILQTLRNNAVY